MPASKDVADSVRSTSQDLLQLGLRYADATDFLKVALGRIAAACGTDRVAVMRSSAGRWSTVAAFGPTASGASGPAPKLLAEALDREEAIAADGWLTVPLEHHAASGELLAIAVREPAQVTRLQETVAQIAPSFSMALTAVRNAQRDRRRRERLESLLAISSQWNRTLATSAGTSPWIASSCGRHTCAEALGSGPARTTRIAILRPLSV